MRRPCKAKKVFIIYTRKVKKKNSKNFGRNSFYNKFQNKLLCTPDKLHLSAYPRTPSELSLSVLHHFPSTLQNKKKKERQNCRSFLHFIRFLFLTALRAAFHPLPAVPKAHLSYRRRAHHEFSLKIQPQSLHYKHRRQTLTCRFRF